jgi:two-component system NtrC family sensor kinase
MRVSLWLGRHVSQLPAHYPHIVSKQILLLATCAGLSFPSNVLALPEIIHECLSPVCFFGFCSAIALLSWTVFRLMRKQASLQRMSLELDRQIQERNLKLSDIGDNLRQESKRHKETEELLRNTQDYLNCIINSMPSVLISMTPQGIITHWNTSAAMLTHLSANQVLGHSLEDVFPELDIPKGTINMALKSRTAQVRENIVFKSSNQPDRHIDITVYPLLSNKNAGVVVRVDDVTMRVKMETVMVQNEKMLSLGELAAGMAHEINNPLGAILQAIQNIRRRVSTQLVKNQAAADLVGIKLENLEAYFAERKLYQFLDSIQQAGERASFIVKNMLEFSRAGHQHQWVNLNHIVQQTLELAQHTFDAEKSFDFRSIDIKVSFDEQLPLVPCSSAELQQVILNLISNAAQAIAQDPQPKLDSRIEVKTYLSAKHQVIIQVSDNGPGMSEHIKHHLFEPFFTTKEVGKGTGLGLSVSYFIIKKHHQGEIWAESTIGQGSDFFVELPIRPHWNPTSADLVPITASSEEA